MTHEEGREVMRDLSSRAAIAHTLKDYRLRNELCWLHDTVALAILNGDEIPTLPHMSRHGCMFRKLAA